jgi:hypothetical protein
MAGQSTNSGLNLILVDKIIEVLGQVKGGKMDPTIKMKRLPIANNAYYCSNLICTRVYKA